MKCDELKVYVPQDGPWVLEPEEGGKLVEEETCYLKSEVDAAIAELKQKLAEKESWVKMLGEGEAAMSSELEKTKQKLHDAEMREDLAEAAETERKIDYDKLKAENERLTRELEHVKNGDCINTCDVLEKYGKELCATRRELWLARVERAKDKQTYHTHTRGDGWCHRVEQWIEVERKCLKKAEEYK